MMRTIADLPVEVQMDLREKRKLIPGWAEMTTATTDQWMAFYQILNAPAREYIVEALLDYSEIGSKCVQADHESMDASYWQQLTGVVSLHNERVNEVEALKDQNAKLRRLLQEIATPEQLAEAERRLHPVITMEIAEPETPEAPTVEEISAAAPADGFAFLAPHERSLELLEVRFTDNPLPGHTIYVTGPVDSGQSRNT